MRGVTKDFKEGRFVLRLVPAPRSAPYHTWTVPSKKGASESEIQPSLALLHNLHFLFSLPFASVIPIFIRTISFCRAVFKQYRHSDAHIAAFSNVHSKSGWTTCHASIKQSRHEQHWYGMKCTRLPGEASHQAFQQQRGSRVKSPSPTCVCPHGALSVCGAVLWGTGALTTFSIGELLTVGATFSVLFGCSPCRYQKFLRSCNGNTARASQRSLVSS